MLKFYAAMTLGTALYLWRVVSPKGAGGWLALFAIALMWPGVVTLALYYAITPDRNPEGENAEGG